MKRQSTGNFWEGILISILILGISLTIAFPGEAQALAPIQPLLPQDLVLTPSPKVSTHLPANVAFDGTRYLVVWGEYFDKSNYWVDIYGQFIKPSGELDGTSFVIAHNTASDDAPAIAFNGTNYLVTWCNNGVKARLVSPQGTLLLTEITIASSQDPQNHVEVASDGSRFMIVWFISGPTTKNYDVYGQFVNSDGSLLGTNFLIGEGNQWQSYPGIAYGAGKYLISWRNQSYINGPSDIYGVIIDAATMTMGSQFPISTALNSQGAETKVAFGKENFLVVWDDSRNTVYGLDIYAARVTPEGVVLDSPTDTGGIIISTDSRGSGPHFPNVTYNGRFWLVVWGGSAIKGVRVTDTGQVLDPQAALLYVDSGDQWHPGIASDGNNFLVTWRGWDTPFTKYAQLVGEISTNQPPTADAGGDQVVNEGALVSLVGSGIDSDNDPLTYSWTQVGGPSVDLNDATTANPSFNAPSVTAGGATLTFQLIVSDGQSFSAPDTVDVTVKNVNKPPIADAGNVCNVREGGTVNLDGSYSYDPDGETLAFEWVQTAGPAVVLSGADTAKPFFSAPEVGQDGVTLTFALTVSDGIDSANASINVIVENVNHPPTANSGDDQTKIEGSEVTLNGSGTDSDSDPLSFQWTQVSGPTVSLSGSSTANPTFTAPAVEAGGATLVFSLVVNDGLENSSPSEVTVTIQNVNDPPAANLARANPNHLWPPNHNLVPVEILGVTDPDNDNVTITISGVIQDEPVNGLGDGDTSPDAVIQGNKVLLRAERDGNGNGRVYQISFTAEDDSGGTCTGTVYVGVPHDRKDLTFLDDGLLFDSTEP
jgi:hypothetical protein